MGKPVKNAGAGGAPAATAAGTTAGSTDQGATGTAPGANQSTAGQEQSSSQEASQAIRPGSAGQADDQVSDIAGTAAEITAVLAAADTAVDPNPVENEVREGGFYRPRGVGFSITSLVDGYRRAGRAWSRTPEIVPLYDLTDEQIVILRADREIRIEPVELRDDQAE